MKTKYLLFAGLSLFSLLTSCNATPEKGEQGIQGEQGEKGDKGDTGETGKDGTKIYTGDGIPNDNTGVEGDLYIDTSTWDIYVKGVSTWSKSGNIKGDAGNNGVDGESAYQTWLDNGHIGNENDFLDWLKGTNGTNGVSVTNVYINDDNGNLICELSNGQTVNAGKVKDTTTYTVKYYVDNVLVGTDMNKAWGSKATPPHVNLKDGYELSQWYTIETDGYKSIWSLQGSIVTSNVDLYADATPIEYKINYVLNGEKNDIRNPSTYTVVSDNISLYSPTSDNGIFDGWYSDETFSTECSTITKGSIGDKTFYAKFISYDKIFAKKPELSSDGKTITYGLYPQTYVSDASLISTLETLSPESNGWYLHDLAYYTKLVANPDGTKTFSNGDSITSGNTYWFKCEPIEWKVINSSVGTYFLTSTKILDAYNFTIEPTASSNYANSAIRTWLNGTFYNSAFNLNNSYVQNVTVNNSASTTSSNSNSYACSNTEDYVYLLSHSELNSNGFSNDTRACSATDYAKANHVNVNSSNNNSWYWTRSPASHSDGFTNIVNYQGRISDALYQFTPTTTAGVRPAIKITIS